MDKLLILTTVYVKFHKPKGYITAVDAKHPVVMDLLPPEYILKMGVVPMGRLDKDYRRFTVPTNDGG